MISKHGNWKYTGGSPLSIGDMYFSPDKIRDFQYCLDQVGRLGLGMTWNVPCILKGGVVTKGAGDTLNITALIGLVYYEVSIPDSFASLPPSELLADVAKIVEVPAQTNLAIPSATLNGIATNYIKVQYTETDGNTRTRKYSAGSYSYERILSFTITVDTTPPDADYDLVLGTLVGTSGGSFTIVLYDNQSPLRRSSADFSSNFIHKSIPESADILLFEDTASSGIKKYATVDEVTARYAVNNAGVAIGYGASSCFDLLKPVSGFAYFYSLSPDYMYGINLMPGRYKMASMPVMSPDHDAFMVYQNGNWQEMSWFVSVPYGFTSRSAWEFYITGAFGVDSLSDLSEIRTLVP